MRKCIVFLMTILIVILSTVVCYSEDVSAYIKAGDYGENVIALHKKLAELGYYSLRAESPYGPQSAAALKILQRVLGWEETGIVQNADELDSILSMIITQEDRDNILRHTDTPHIGTVNYGEGVWRSASGGEGIREVMSITDAPIDDIISGVHLAGNAGYKSNTAIGMDDVPVEYGVKYELSCYAKGNGKLGLQHGKGPYPIEMFDVTDDWQRYRITFVIGDDDGSTKEAPDTKVFFGVPAGVDSDLVICDMQLTLEYVPVVE